jgi:hypothetical protein
MDNTEFKDLLNKTINEVYIGEDKTYLKFVTSEGEFSYYAYGDCCSQSWFNHLDGLDRLIGQEVKQIVGKPSSEVLPEKDQDQVEMYGWTLITPKGYVDLEMRNDSNGYYGGSVERIGAPDRSSRTMTPPEGGWELVKEDF